jgi:hypothetical protein
MSGVSRAGVPTGTGVANLTTAGNAVWCDDGPEFIWNRLEVSGPDEVLYDFIGAASGPGFVDWRPEWHGVYEQIYFETVRGGAPTREAAEHLARTLRDILWRRHEVERARVDLDSHRVPLDLNALIPIPRRICGRDLWKRGRSGCGRIGACGGPFGVSVLRWSGCGVMKAAKSGWLYFVF